MDNEDLDKLLLQFEKMEPEQIGMFISIAIEYLIDFHNYDLNKMLDTIKRVHDRMNSDGKDA